MCPFGFPNDRFCTIFQSWLPCQALGCICFIFSSHTCSHGDIVVCRHFYVICRAWGGFRQFRRPLCLCLFTRLRIWAMKCSIIWLFGHTVSTSCFYLYQRLTYSNPCLISTCHRLRPTTCLSIKSASKLFSLPLARGFHRLESHLFCRIPSLFCTLEWAVIVSFSYIVLWISLSSKVRIG